MTMDSKLTRRDLLQGLLMASATIGLCGRGSRIGDRTPAVPDDPDLERLKDWVNQLRSNGLSKPPVPIGKGAIRVGELAAGTPYKAGTLEEYLREGGVPAGPEPLTLSLTHFDCVTLVESCLAVARVAARYGDPTWERFGAEVERMRYRDGHRLQYPSRLHYFSEWIRDGQRRGLVRDIGQELGAKADSRPLRFMTEHRQSYPAMADNQMFEAIKAMELRLDDQPRWVVPTEKIDQAADRIQSGDVLAFATAIPGLDVTHSAMAHRGEDRVLRVLHAPLSGGVVEVSRSTLPDYVNAIKRATGILVARPL
jgi:hypothetical protein